MGLDPLADHLSRTFARLGPPRPARVACPNCREEIEAWLPEPGTTTPVSCPACGAPGTLRSVKRNSQASAPWACAISIAWCNAVAARSMSLWNFLRPEWHQYPRGSKATRFLTQAKSIRTTRPPTLTSYWRTGISRPHARSRRIEDAVTGRDAHGHGVDQDVAVVGGVEIGLAAHRRNTHAVAVAADAGHHARHQVPRFGM